MWSSANLQSSQVQGTSYISLPISKRQSLFYCQLHEVYLIRAKKYLLSALWNSPFQEVRLATSLIMFHYLIKHIFWGGEMFIPLRKLFFLLFTSLFWNFFSLKHYKYCVYIKSGKTLSVMHMHWKSRIETVIINSLLVLETIKHALRFPAELSVPCIWFFFPSQENGDEKEGIDSISLHILIKSVIYFSNLLNFFLALISYLGTSFCSAPSADFSERQYM